MISSHGWCCAWSKEHRFSTTRFQGKGIPKNIRREFEARDAAAVSVTFTLRPHVESIPYDQQLAATTQKLIASDSFSLPFRLSTHSLPRSWVLHSPKMVSKVLFWAGFGKSYFPYSTSASVSAGSSSVVNMIAGVAVRVWQLGIEMRPFLTKQGLWVYPIFAGTGAGFGYWMTGVENRQYAILAARRESLLEKRARRAEREATEEEA